MAWCELLQCERAASPCLSSNGSSGAPHLAPVLLKFSTDCLLPSMQIFHSTRCSRCSWRWGGLAAHA